MNKIKEIESLKKKIMVARKELLEAIRETTFLVVSLRKVDQYLNRKMTPCSGK